jgi:integrase
MARSQTPSYCFHRATGQAYVTLKRDGRKCVRYLGKWGSPESLTQYESALLESGLTLPLARLAVQSALSDILPDTQVGSASNESQAPTVRVLYDRFMAWAPTHYRLPTGATSKEVEQFRYTFADVLTHLGHRPTASLAKRDLEMVRDAMVGRGLSRKVVNQRISRIQHVVRWGTEENRTLVPDAVAAVLCLLAPLQAYRTAAPERGPVLGVPSEQVEKVAGAANAVVASMIRLQLLTGFRPGEVRGLRRKMVVQKEGRWVADFGTEHKMAYRRQKRVVPLGDRAMALLQPWLLACPDGDAFVFRPTQQKGSRGRLQQFTRYGYEHSIKWACKKAGVAPFAPNRIRHTVGEEVRKSHGLEYVQALLGHKNRQSSERYAPVVEDLAVKVASIRG